MSADHLDQATAALQRGGEEAATGRREGAIDSFRTAARLCPADARIQVRAGEGLGNLGCVVEAEGCFRRALDNEPGFHLARFNLALARLAQGDPAGACALLREVVAARPDVPPAWLHLGGVLNALGRYREAGEALERYLRLTPGDPVGLTWQGASLQFRGAFDEAEHCYREALRSDPAFTDAHANLGKLLQAQGMPDAAEAHFREALGREPAHPQALSGLATWMDNDGRYDEAIDLLDRSGLPPEHPDLAPIRARCLRNLGRQTEARQVLERAIACPGITADSRIQLQFSLAVACDTTGHYAAAWSHAEAANRMKRESLPGGAPEADLAAMESAVVALKEAFSREAMDALPRSKSDTRQPVFVVGMPRSGKSLVEQILCSHGEVRGAGELTAMGDVSARLERRTGAWPQGVSRVTPTDLDEMAALYLETLTREAPRSARITDTMPFNFVHLGLIAMLFPRARVVHCIRHPLDLVLRCYFKNFAGRSLSFAFSVEDTVRYYGLYRDLMRHWATVAGPAIHVVRYEDLARDTEAQARGLIEFLGLDWDAACLDFYRAGVASSAAQTPIRCPLHEQEIGTWKNYSERLADAARALPVAEYEHGGF